METAHLKELIDLEDSYWWHVAKRQMVTDWLQRYVPSPAKLIEGGIGGSGNLSRWRNSGYQVTGLDFMPESIAHAKACGLNDVYQHDLHEPWPVAEGTAEGVVLLDVLEHLRDPVLALQHAARSLTATGRIVFTVPAYPWLFSEWDQRLGHYRRYTVEMMQQQVADAGLQLERIRHWNAFTLPAAVLVRLARRLRPYHQGSEFPRVAPWMNRTLITAANWEQKLADSVGLPLGLSLVGVIRR